MRGFTGNKEWQVEPVDSFIELEGSYGPDYIIEEKLIKIWKRILKTDKVGVEDTFFELGGHSITIIELEVAIENEFGVHIEFENLYKNLTIKQLINLIKESNEQRNRIINSVEEREYYPTSLSQRNIYVIDQRINENTGFNLPIILKVEKGLDRNKVQAVFQQLINRHEAFRTYFEIINEELVQKIQKEAYFELEYYEATEEDVKAITEKFIRPFNLREAPLFRGGLIKLGKSNYVLMADMHHIISDGSSLNILFKEFSQLCKEKQLPELEITYKDFAVIQNEMLKTDEGKKREEYWRNIFSSGIPVNNLPYDFVKGKELDYIGGRINFTISGDMSERLLQIATEKNTTLHTMIFSIFSILLFKYCSQEEIAISSIVSGRNYAKLQDIIGSFVNVVPIKVQGEAHTKFVDFMQSVRDVLLGAYENQEYPIDELLNTELAYDINSISQLYDIMLIFHNEVDIEHREGNKCFKYYNYGFDENDSNRDIQMNVFINDNGQLECILDYNSRLFKEETITRMAEHFINIAKKVIENKEIEICKIDMLSEKEKNQIVYDFNDTEVKFDESKTVHHLFEQQAEINPNRNAIIFRGRNYTYNEINEKSNQIARHLVKKGIRKEQIVAVMMERSHLLVECVLGIWKAGGVYLPIDPEYPSERINVILKESGAEVMITYSEYIREDIEKEYLTYIINLDLCEKDIFKERKENLELNIFPNNLAYVIYTSGSTGKPKGAMIEHIGMINHIIAEIDELKINQDSVIAQNASQCFDISIWQFFAAITIGAKTAIYDNEIKIEPHRFIEQIIEDGVTVLEVVPSFLSVMMDYLKEKDSKFLSLEYLMITGEEVKKGIVERWFDTWPGIKMVNAYGPAEAADDVTQYIMGKTPETSVVPIGKPIQNMKIYIVDKYMNLCPVGIIGEICVAGIGVGRGYLNNLEKTEKVFIKDPFLGELGGRLYKTGDLGRWLSDGNIEFFGRADYQVKVRGFRIELGEIEMCLLTHPFVRECVVTLREDIADNKCICAYITSNKELDELKLEEYMLNKLPEYMIPSYFMQLEKLPLSPNGKVDRAKLPIPILEDLVINECDLPKNKIEEQLSGIWKDILSVDRIGISDNFFKKGGNSLKAIVASMRISKELNSSVPVSEIFKTPTIAGIAEYILSNNNEEFSHIEIVEKKDYYLASSVQKRLYTLNKFEVESTSYNIPLAIEIRGELNKERVQYAFNELVQRHEALRTCFEIIDSEIVQKISESIDIKINYLEEREDNIRSVIKRLVRSFDLHEAPLLRVTLIGIANDRHVLLMDIHHIITDGTSNEILINEFLRLYRGESLPEVKVQYKDCVAWQNQFFESDRMKKQEEYWLDNFRGKIQLTNIPLDYPRPAIQSFEGERIVFNVDEKLTVELNQLVAETGTTMYMVLLAAYKILVANYSCQDEIIVGTPIIGRSHTDMENVIGMFVNTLAIRSYPMGDKEFVRYLEEVKEILLKSYENQDYPLEMLLENINLPKNFGRNPLFDVVFSYSDIRNGKEDSASDLDLSYYQFENAVSKFDITMFAFESDENIFFVLEYCTKLFKRETIEKFTEHYLKVLKSIVSNKKIKINEIALESFDYESEINLEEFEFNF